MGAGYTCLAAALPPLPTCTGLQWRTCLVEAAVHGNRKTVSKTSHNWRYRTTHATKIIYNFNNMAQRPIGHISPTGHGICHAVRIASEPSVHRKLHACNRSTRDCCDCETMHRPSKPIPVLISWLTVALRSLRPPITIASVVQLAFPQLMTRAPKTTTTYHGPQPGAEPMTTIHHHCQCIHQHSATSCAIHSTR